MTSVGEWGLYPWFELRGESLVLPEDLHSFRSLGPYARVFKCVGLEAPYLVLAHGAMTFRVRPDIFERVPAPTVEFGDAVRILHKGKETPAIVEEIFWHSNRAEPFYHVLVNGKKLSKRYWKDDFL